MTPDLKEYILRWFEKADHDILAAGTIIDLQPVLLDVAGFHCQQAVEKYLKAFLIYHGKDPAKTHNLIFLAKDCSEIDIVFSSIDLKSLNNYSVEVRYPADSIDPTLAEVKEFLKIAEEVKKIVRAKIKFS